ncbi:hypothetical protein HF289_09630 [Acidithiobacillus ferrooxidans]|jgi:hypothetical protein|uniref:hypothetical protein n=1 Tax=Acidithiobacillus TaxID=119977 RepID=UPI0013D4A0D7|nr:MULTISPECIES: hypothetical protein [Acidithiobacillus]MBU2857118.1 hypothetical protein [Acidithiobacillus ferrooxidans]MBU2861152.1 hypothetical protein [Acidithiobacillus ferrooxidans]MCR2828724.1 hypothetical protein [Acidithiobacillus ferrooxidans]MDA8153604.1 hypothetical protein [Acidithiobacillus sp.]
MEVVFSNLSDSLINKSCLDQEAEEPKSEDLDHISGGFANMWSDAFNWFMAGYWGGGGVYFANKILNRP